MTGFIRIGIIAIAGATVLYSCSSGKTERHDTDTRKAAVTELERNIKEVADSTDGLVGVAVITADHDTVTVNNDSHYPLMSVFKLHQALAVCHALEEMHRSVDTILTIDTHKLNHNTWSPMLKSLPEGKCDISVRELLRYTLQQSDNNASNIMFDRIVPVRSTDSFIRNSTGIEDFNLSYTEANMQENNNLSLQNWSTPSACAELICKVVNDSLISTENQNFIIETLTGCQTGRDRLYSPFVNMPEIKIAHKTGSGYRDGNGRLMAHNDIGYIYLPDGRGYAVAVLVTDFSGKEEEASAIISRISDIVFDYHKH